MLSRSLIAAAFVCAAAAAAHAGPSEVFLGFHPDGTYYATEYSGPSGKLASLCTLSQKLYPRAWPKEIERPEYTTACRSGFPLSKLGDLRKLLRVPASSLKGPEGLELALEVEDIEGITSANVVIKKGDKSVNQNVLGDSKGAKLGGVWWHPTGAGVVYQVVTADGSAVYRQDLETLVPGPHKEMKWNDRKGAEAALAKARAEIKKDGRIDWEAMRELERAVELDPTWPLAHYEYAAALASRSGSWEKMIDELGWLKVSDSADAKKLLAKAKLDAAFDGFASDKDYRETVGLPPWSQMVELDRLWDRRGEWSADGLTCREPHLTMLFKKGGKVSMRYRYVCNQVKKDQTLTGSYFHVPGDPNATGDARKGFIRLVFKQKIDRERLKELDHLDFCSDGRSRGSAPCFNLATARGGSIELFSAGPGEMRILK